MRGDAPLYDWRQSSAVHNPAHQSEIPKAFPKYLFPGKHIFNIHNKSDTFTVEVVNTDLRHYIPTLARRSRCFPRKLENLQAVLAVFVQAYNRSGRQKHLYRSRHPGTSVPFSVFDFP